jgi:peptidoglycan-associated lipoprotein
VGILINEKLFKKEGAMKKLIAINFCLILLFCTSCQNTSSQEWENVKTASRYLNKGIDALIGKDFETRLITNENEFVGPSHEEFIPLCDDDLQTQFVATDLAIAQPKASLGESASGVPKMEKFETPGGKLASIFKTIHFETDNHVVKNQNDLITVSQIASFLKRNPNYYIITEGHTDKRASSAYNMALGTRRANHIRVLLIKQGVDFNKIYTVSFGKEKPLVVGNTRDDLLKNRRAEFKIFKR